MKLSLIIEAIVRGKAPLDGVTKSVKALDRAADTASRGGLARAGQSIDRAERSAGRLTRAAERMGFAIGSGARRGILGLIALERRLTISRAGMGKLAALAGSVAGGALAAGTAAVGAGVFGGLYKVVSAGMMFEKFRTQLTGLEGSVAAGNKAMDWVTKFAATTPYEIGEVMEAFIQLKAYGLDPTNGTLRILGDTAGGMGKSLSQAVEMIADASTGEFERIKEFGIKASQKGDQVTFSFTKNGKQMTRVAKKNAADIQKVLFAIFSDRFAGGMDRLAKTTEGKWSNVMDRLTISAKRVWEGGLSASVNKQLDRFTAWVDGLEKNGNLAKWAENTGKGLGDFVAEIGEMDWKQFGQDVAGVAGAIRDLASALSTVDRFGGALRNALSPPKDWPGLGVAIGRGLGIIPSPQGAVAAPRARAPMPAPTGQSLERWKRAAASSANAPKGHIKVEIAPPKGFSLRPTKIAGDGVDLSVGTGPAMGPFA